MIQRVLLQIEKMQFMKKEIKEQLVDNEKWKGIREKDFSYRPEDVSY
mgnify:CR=1